MSQINYVGLRSTGYRKLCRTPIPGCCPSHSSGKQIAKPQAETTNSHRGFRLDAAKQLPKILIPKLNKLPTKYTHPGPNPLRILHNLRGIPTTKEDIKNKRSPNLHTDEFLHTAPDVYVRHLTKLFHKYRVAQETRFKDPIFTNWSNERKINLRNFVLSLNSKASGFTMAKFWRKQAKYKKFFENQHVPQLDSLFQAGTRRHGFRSSEDSNFIVERLCILEKQLSKESKVENDELETSDSDSGYDSDINPGRCD
jgi:hypothetical protein